MSPLRDAPRIAVTGLSFLSPMTDDPEALRVALEAGEHRLRNDPDDPEGPAASRIEEFDPRRYANIRGMRVYPRNTQLQICAAAQALTHAGLELGKIDATELGTITASTYAHVETLLEYDRGLVTVGIQRTNPTLFPLSLPSAPGALTALSLVAKAFAITVSDGDGSGLAALALGARLLSQGRAKVCVVTGAFTQCAELTAAARQLGLLASGREGFRPFDRHSRGTAFGELAVALVLEPAASAEARGRSPLGYVHGHAATFASTDAQRTSALLRACRGALATTHTDAATLALISASARGVVASDADEAQALSALLGEAAGRVPVTAVKSLLGESLDASGLAQAGLALLQLRAGRASAIAGLRAPSVAGLRYQIEPGALSGTQALVTSISDAGSCGALLLSVSP
jgi:3-oxoacyl-[acyl-carrier-protein] synthase II